MTLDFREPIPVKQLDGSPFAGLNCTCASAAMGLDRASDGKKITSGSRVRALTGDTTGGTTLTQVDNALRWGWGVDIDVRSMIAFLDLCDEVASGHGAIIQGHYGVFHTYELAGSRTFFGNHAIWWNEVHLVWTNGLDLDLSSAYIYDPLWDGRRSYVPDRRFRWVPLRMIYQFAALLTLGSGKIVGPGRAYAALAPRTKPIGETTQPPAVKIDYGRNPMIVAGGLVLGSSHRMALKKGQALYREPKSDAPVVTRMSKTATVKYMGVAASGWRAVLVSTSNFADRVLRPVIVYVPASAGNTSKA